MQQTFQNCCGFSTYTTVTSAITRRSRTPAVIMILIGGYARSPFISNPNMTKRRPSRQERPTQCILRDTKINDVILSVSSRRCFRNRTCLVVGRIGALDRSGTSPCSICAFEHESSLNTAARIHPILLSHEVSQDSHNSRLVTK